VILQSWYGAAFGVQIMAVLQLSWKDGTVPRPIWKFLKVISFESVKRCMLKEF